MGCQKRGGGIVIRIVSQPVSRIGGIEYVDHGPDWMNSTARDQSPPQTLVCLHGIGGDHASFEPQYQSLSDEYRILSWNMPGYRGSDPLENMDFDTLSASFVGWLDALNLDQVHIMGQSIGGMLAQEIGFRHPERVQSLILVATTSAFGGRDDSFKQAFLEARLAPLDQGETMPVLAPRFVPEIVGKDAPQEAIESAIHSMAAVPESTYRQIMTCLVTFNRRTEWPDLGLSVCLIAGSEDTNAPARTMEKMAANLEGCAYHCIEGAGHLVNLEQPKACNDIVRRFLSTF